MKFSRVLASVSLLLCTGFAAQQSRIKSVDLDSEVRVRVPETQRPFSRPENDRGRLDPNKVLSGVTIHFSRTPAQQAELDQLLRELQTPGSPNFHQWIGSDEFGRRFGVSQADLDKITQWLRANGFTVDAPPASRDRLSFTGTVAQVESAFQTELHNYAVNGETHFGNNSDIALPKSVAPMVLSVTHLDDLKLKPHGIRRVSPRLTSNISGNNFLVPDDFATIFGVKALYAAGFDGTGHTIAVVGRTKINQSNIDAFRANSGLSAKQVTMTVVPGTACAATLTGDLDEAYLDVEWSGAVAKGATINYVFVGDGKTAGCGAITNTSPDVFDALVYAIDNNLAPVVSISYGNCEPNFGKTFTDTVRAEAQKAVASNGQTVIAASGDNAAADCEAANATKASLGPAVDVPAAVPEVTGVGGTTFTADSSAKTQFWNTSNNANAGSARSYIGEGAWNDSQTGAGLAGSGGGESTFYKHSADASWQVAPGVPTSVDARFVPDVSLPAAPGHDGWIFCGEGWCSPTAISTPVPGTGFRNSAQTFDVIGGTSVGAPVFAGLLTIIEQAVGSNGEGNLNLHLYQLAQNATAYASAFHDVTSGDNIVPCNIGTPGCTTGTFGFTTNAGYDMVTGLGSVDGYNLEEAYASVVKSNGKSITNTAVTGNTSNIQPGQNVTFTASVSAPGGAGVPASGNVGFLVDGDYSGQQVAVSNGQATFTTSFAASGPHTVAATFFGTAGFAGSNSAPLSFALASSGPASFAMSASPTTLTIKNAAGQSATSLILLQGSNGFSSTISLGCSVAFAGTGTAGTLPTCALSSTSATLSASSTTANSTLTVAIPAVAGALRSPVQPHDRGLEWWAIGSSAAFGCVFLTSAPGRRKFLGVPLLAIAAILGGCSGVPSKSSGTSSSAAVVSGNYVVTVTATPNGGTAQKTTVNVTVQ